ncbi:MAG TPA: DUF6531 domain-containing protein, partial [Treponemataceae bacterium]|nr:DUF6531 domain-containing protein [Treponemataceae bacterium]
MMNKIKKIEKQGVIAMKKDTRLIRLLFIVGLFFASGFITAQDTKVVESYNFEKNTMEYKEYQDIHQHSDPGFILELKNGKRIERSSSQEVYIIENGWATFAEEPEAFKQGNHALVLVANKVIAVEIQNSMLTGNVYLYETYRNVADNHNYFFDSLLVHNCTTGVNYDNTGRHEYKIDCHSSSCSSSSSYQGGGGGNHETPKPPSKCGGCGHESCTCVANAQANLEKAKEVKKIPQSEIERLEVILESAKKNSADKTNTTKSEKGGDPVRIATGEFIVEETDFIFSRLYTSQQQEAGSLGKNWSSSLDSRLIRGITSGARESVQIIHETAIVPITASYNSNLNSAKYNSGVMESVNSIKTILEEATQQWESLKKTADEADILRSLNIKVRLHGLPICFEQTGNGTITIITENGSPILFKYIGYGIWAPVDTILAKTTLLKSVNGKNSESAEGFILSEKGGVKKYFDKYGLLNYIEDRNGNKIIFTRNQSTGVIQSVDTKQGQYICTYDGLYLKSISGPGNQTVLFQYTNGFLTSVTDTDGDTVNYEYIEGQMSRIIKPGLNSFITLTYNDVGSNGRKLATRTSHEEGDCEKFDYYPEENKTVYTNHSGIVTIYYYDGSNRTIREDSSDGTSSTYVYNDVTGYLESQSKFSANYHYDTIIYTYDNIGNKTKALYSDNSSDNWSWNEFCQMTSYTDRDGFRTEWDYDTKGNCTFIYTYSTPISKQKVFTATYFDDGRLKTSKKGNQEVYTYSYDNAGNLKEKSIVINGNTIKEHWISDPVGRIQKYTDGENRTWTYEYPKKSKNANRLVIEKTPDGLEKIYEYNNRKDLVKISEKDTFSLELRTTVIEYDRRHLPIKITNGNGDITEYTYRKDGKIESLKEGVWKQEFTYKEIDGRLETIKKSMNGSLETYTETYTNVLNSTGEIHRLSRPGPHNMSIATDYQYDYWNRITSVENAAEERSTREFSFAGRLLREQTASGGFIIYTYNDSGQLINIGKEDQKAIAVTYNSDGTIATKTDRNNVTTTYEYDGRGLIVREYTLAGEKIYIYDKIDRIIRLEINTKNTAIQGEGTSFTTWDYNDEARTIKITEGDLYETVWEKNAWGEIIKKTDSEGNTFSWAYYGNGKLKSAIDAYGKVTSYTWNALGKINTITNPDATVENYEYNHLGYVIRVSDALGEKWKGTYDEAGRLKSETGRPGIDKKYTYDELDRIISVSSGGEIIEKYAYSTRGTEIHFTDGKGDTYTYTKDEYGELISEKNRNSDMRSYKYDFEGRPVILSQFSGKVETTNYDDNTLKITTTYEDQTTTVITKDYAGRITQVKGSTGTISYYYNAAGKLIRQNDEKAGEETVYKYDGAGRKIKMDSGNREVSYRYGKNGEIVTVEDNKQRLYVNFKYDIMGREISRIYGNGVLQETQYDAIGRTVMIREISATRELIRAEAYLYDYLGRRSHSVDERGNVTRYEYDSQSRLSNVRYPFSEEKSLTDKKEAQEAGNIFSIEHGKAEWYQFTNIESQELREVLNLVSP